MNKYRYIYMRVDYPRARGYRIEVKHLPDWMYLTIDSSKSSKWLTVHSRIHKNKAVIMQPMYNSDWSDDDVIRDLSGRIYRRWVA